MQPYFLPYIGYFQLIASVDVFIVYDNIKYTKKGWINRNRMLTNGSDAFFSIPLKKGSDSLHVVQRELSNEFDRKKLLNHFKEAYRRAPYFFETFPLLERIVYFQDDNLFRYIYNSIVEICFHLGINTDIRTSSAIAIDNNLKNQNKVIALCNATGANTYVNAIGGVELYTKEDFRAQDIEIQFLKSKSFEYPQLGASFIPWLSIIDVLMFNPLDTVRECIDTNYEII